MDKVNLAEKFAKFHDYWAPKIVGEVNDQYVKIAKLKGTFTRHRHENEDEFFFVLKGCLVLELPSQKVVINEGEFFVVPRGEEHLPIAEEETWVLKFEPKSKKSLGGIGKREPERI